MIWYNKAKLPSKRELGERLDFGYTKAKQEVQAFEQVDVKGSCRSSLDSKVLSEGEEQGATLISRDGIPCLR